MVYVSDYPTLSIAASNTNGTIFKAMQELVDVNSNDAVILLNNYSQSATVEHDNAENIVPIASAIAQREGYPWSDMDWSDMRRPCGGSKCLYVSLADPSFGYLVARRQLDLDELIQGYEIGQNLSTYHDVPNLSVERPYIIHNVSSHMMAVLFAYNHLYYKHSFDDGRNLIVQKIRMTPNPSVLIGLCKLIDGNQNLAKNHRKIEEMGSLVREHGDMESFHETYKQELEKTLQIMKDQRYFSLFKDFQVVVDITGKFYHIDLDRGVRETYRSWKQRRWHRQLETGMYTVLDWFTEDTSLIDFTKRDHEYLEYAAC